jgi:uncharacterized peroxidase-related enzyme
MTVATTVDTSRTVKDWTLDKLDWRPWVQTIDTKHLTDAQKEALSEAPGGLENIGAYYATLAHDPAILRERTRLFNAVMYGRGGAARAVRELAAVAGSRYNGCVYCASVHARLYNDLTHTTDVIDRIFKEGVETPLEPREKAVVDFSVKLTKSPDAVTPEDLAPLRSVGYSDLEILDIVHSVAMFAWANRLLQTLGQPERPSS